MTGTSTMLSSSKVYVGGSQTTHALPGSKIHNNFVGCLRKVSMVKQDEGKGRETKKK